MGNDDVKKDRVLILPGDAGITCIREIHSDLGSGLGGNDGMIVDFSATERIDLALAQVLLAASRKAKSEGKNFGLRGVDARKKAMLVMAGIVKEGGG